MSSNVAGGPTRPGDRGEVGPLQAAGRQVDESKPVQAVRETIDSVRDRVAHLQEDISEGYQRLRAQNVGDLIDGTLDGVQRNPGRGLVVAFAAGLALAWVFRD